MKEKLWILIAGIAVSSAVCFFWRKCPPPSPIVSSCFMTLRVSAREGRDSITIQVPYRCNELVVRKPDEGLIKWLMSKGFTPVDTCSCNEGMMLFRSQGVDPVGVVENPKSGTKDSTMTLNYIIPVEPARRFPILPMAESDSFPGNPPAAKARSIVKVAIIDTGTDPFHLELGNSLWVNRGDAGCPGLPVWMHGLDMTDYSEGIDIKGHGTHVGGIVAGYSKPFLPDYPDRNVRIELINVKVTDNKDDEADLFKATCGMHYALKQGAKVLNLSWGYYTGIKDSLIDKDMEFPALMLDALQEAKDSGAVIVAALGNEQREINDNVHFWPAGFSETWDNVISVGASDENGDKASFSNSSTNQNLMTTTAPGKDVLSTVPKIIRRRTADGWITIETNGFGQASGTSMAAPYVSRAVALMMAKKMPAPNQIGSVKSNIIATQKIGNNGWKSLDPKKALDSW